MADKVLSEEVERLQKLQQEQILSSSKHRRTDSGRLSTSSGDQTASREIYGSSPRRHKSRKHSGSQKESTVALCGVDQDDIFQREPANNLHTEALQALQVYHMLFLLHSLKLWAEIKVL